MSKKKEDKSKDIKKNYSFTHKKSIYTFSGENPKEDCEKMKIKLGIIKPLPINKVIEPVNEESI